MQIRPVIVSDLDQLSEIDATIESSQYLHLEKSGETPNLSWKLESRPLRDRLITQWPWSDEQRFATRQIATGADEGVALLAEHDSLPVALMLAQPDPGRQVLKLLDLRVDFEHRRQGLAMGMLYQLIQSARDDEFRAVAAETTANNFPANELLAKVGFELTGLDTHRNTNHDLVKEAVTLFWYIPLS